MLPGLRLVLVAIAATILIVVLGFAQLVKLQVAQSQSANLAPVEARFAGLAFAARADWAPIPISRVRSLEAMAPFANIPLAQSRLRDAPTEAAEMAKSAALAPIDPVAAEVVPAAEPRRPSRMRPRTRCSPAEPLRPRPPKPPPMALAWPLTSHCPASLL